MMWRRPWRIPRATERELLARIGTGDGQVLAPLQGMVSQVERATLQRIQEVRELLSETLDPAKATSVLGAALERLRDLLDPDRSDSVQGRLFAAVGSVTAQDGSLAESVATVVRDAVAPLADEVRSLSLEVRGAAAADEIVKQSTLKGRPYEEQVAAKLQAWAAEVGASFDYCGGDNKPGDVALELGPASLGPTGMCVVVECRDDVSGAGRKVIRDAAERALRERNGTHVIYLGRSKGALAKEIGEWSEGTCSGGSWLATTDEYLRVALRFVMVMERARCEPAASFTDRETLQRELSRLRDAMRLLTNISTRAGNIRAAAEQILADTSRLRLEANEALTVMEHAATPPAATAA
jgi:hypothetical protein